MYMYTAACTAAISPMYHPAEPGRFAHWRLWAQRRNSNNRQWRSGRHSFSKLDELRDELLDGVVHAEAARPLDLFAQPLALGLLPLRLGLTAATVGPRVVGVFPGHRRLQPRAVALRGSPPGGVHAGVVVRRARRRRVIIIRGALLRPLSPRLVIVPARQRLADGRCPLLLSGSGSQS